MDKDIKRLIESIEKAFIELKEKTGATHISAFMINGSICINDYTDLNNPKFDHYRKIEKVEG